MKRVLTASLVLALLLGSGMAAIVNAEEDEVTQDDLLKTRGEGGIAFLMEQRAPRVGAPLRSGSLSRIEESATQPDTVEIDVNISVPLPLNNIKLTLLV